MERVNLPRSYMLLFIAMACVVFLSVVYSSRKWCYNWAFFCSCTPACTCTFVETKKDMSGFVCSFSLPARFVYKWLSALTLLPTFPNQTQFMDVSQRAHATGLLVQKKPQRRPHVLIIEELYLTWPREGFLSQMIQKLISRSFFTYLKCIFP